MGINTYNVKKWTRMIFGKSILYVKQDKGKIYSNKKILGYYNDLTQKVINLSKLNINEIPKTESKKGKHEFSIGVFQYGLGAYDLFLINNEEEYLERFKTAVKWAMDNQLDNGGWKTFENENPTNPFSSMAQGEGASLLFRAYIQFNDDKYKKAAKKAIEFMIIPIEENGTAKYEENNIYLQEFPNMPTVLNGWIFSIFGIYDYLLIYKDDKKVKEIYLKTIETLKKELKKFDLGYWSKYNINTKIASPFYHRLHTPLLDVLKELTNEKEFGEYAIKFEKYGKNRLYKSKAFIIKAWQKIREKG